MSRDYKARPQSTNYTPAKMHTVAAEAGRGAGASPTYLPQLQHTKQIA